MYLTAICFSYPTVIFSDWYRTRRILRRTSGVTVPLKPPFLNKLSMVWILSHPEEQKKIIQNLIFKVLISRW